MAASLRHRNYVNPVPDTTITGGKFWVSRGSDITIQAVDTLSGSRHALAINCTKGAQGYRFLFEGDGDSVGLVTLCDSLRATVDSQLLGKHILSLDFDKASIDPLPASAGEDRALVYRIPLSCVKLELITYVPRFI